ncbi:hypothetical protein [Sphingobacterium sp.]|uniref:hypothetical protein n=1 Tax=Sphingobacterium sp. TaxID=341027 RepID=UPI00289E2310|nr:hypothetical protein [Sphingobacterium sp.]
MDKKAIYLTRSFPKLIMLMAVMLFVLLTSCPIKSSIKSLAGFPVNTEQGAAKKNSYTSRVLVEQCSVFESSLTQQVSKLSPDAKQMIPMMLFAVAFLFLLAISDRTTKSHYSNGDFPNSGPIPIFLKYRKLLI